MSIQYTKRGTGGAGEGRFFHIFFSNHFDFQIRCNVSKSHPKFFETSMWSEANGIHGVI